MKKDQKNDSLEKKFLKILETFNIKESRRENLFKMGMLAVLTGKPFVMIGDYESGTNYMSKWISFTIKNSKFVELDLENLSESIFDESKENEDFHVYFIRDFNRNLSLYQEKINRFLEKYQSSLNDLLKKRYYSLILSSKHDSYFEFRNNYPSFTTKEFLYSLDPKSLLSFLQIENLDEDFIPADQKFTISEVRKIRSELKKVQFPKKNHWVIQKLEIKLQEFTENQVKENQKSSDPIPEDRFHISDLRWVTILDLVKSYAFLQGRKMLELSDFAILPNLLWNLHESDSYEKRLIQPILRLGSSSRDELNVIDYFYYKNIWDLKNQLIINSWCCGKNGEIRFQYASGDIVMEDGLEKTMDSYQLNRIVNEDPKYILDHKIYIKGNEFYLLNVVGNKIVCKMKKHSEEVFLTIDEIKERNKGEA